MNVSLKHNCQRIIALFSVIAIMASSIPVSAQENTNNRFSSQYITVDGKQMRVALYGDMVQNGSEISFTDTSKTTLVMLPGLGEISPHLAFKPLAKALDTDFNIVIVEPLGYGLSELAPTARTVENINNEFNEALVQLNINECVILGHSIAGVYGLDFILKHPEKVKGFIAIDNTAYDDLILELLQSQIEPTLAFYADLNATKDSFPSIEDYRLAVLENPEKYYGAVLPEVIGYTYQDSDKEEYMQAFLAAFNKNILDETSEIVPALSSIKGKKFPSSLPLLMMVATESLEIIPAWEIGHRNQIDLESGNHELYILDGPHALWNTKLSDMIEHIKSWKDKFDM